MIVLPLASVIFVGLATAPVSAEPEAKTEQPGIALFDLEPVNGVSAGLAKLLTESLLTRLNASRRFSSVIGGSDIRAMLDMEQQKQVLGCADESCLAELGGALGVPLMVNPTLGLVGGKFLINLKVLAVEEAKVKARTEGVFDSEGDLLNGLPGLVDQLLAELSGDLPPAVPAVSKRVRVIQHVGSGLSVLGAIAVGYGFYIAKTAGDAVPGQGNATAADAEIYENALVTADNTAATGWTLISMGVLMRLAL